MEGKSENMDLQYAVRVKCQPNYYGPQCEQHCVPRDDQFGHYTCGEDGSKVCLDGWQGSFCANGELLFLLKVFSLGTAMFIFTVSKLTLTK